MADAALLSPVRRDDDAVHTSAVYLLAAVCVCVLGIAMVLSAALARRRRSKPAPTLRVAISAPQCAACSRACVGLRTSLECARRARQHVRTPEHATSTAGLPQLVVLINPRSGGGLGRALACAITHMYESAQLPRTHTHTDACEAGPSQSSSDAPTLFRLSREGLIAALRHLHALRGRGVSARVVVAGGDGSVTAVTRALADAGLAAVPVAVCPLGTGNDAALTTGAALPPLDPESIQAWLLRVRTARVVVTDVYTVHFDTYADGGIVCVRSSQPHGFKETQLCETSIRGVALNYVSVGLDARLCYTVELNRASSRWLNKLTYFMAGLYNVLVPRRSPVTRTLQYMVVDGVHVAADALPFPLQTVIALLIPSYAGGINLWNCAWSLSSSLYAKLYGGAHVGSYKTHVLPLSFEPSSTASPPHDDAPADISEVHMPYLRVPVPPALLPPAFLSGVAASQPDRAASGSGSFDSWPPRRTIAERVASRARQLADHLMVALLGGRASWPKQARDDGVLELLGSRTLLQVAGAVGTRSGALGGVYRLGQPSSVSMLFRRPDVLERSASDPRPMLPQEHDPYSQPLSPGLLQQAAALPVPVVTPTVDDKRSPAMMIRSMIGSVTQHVRSRRAKAAVQASPHHTDEDRLRAVEPDSSSADAAEAAVPIKHSEVRASLPAETVDVTDTAAAKTAWASPSARARGAARPGMLVTAQSANSSKDTTGDLTTSGAPPVYLTASQSNGAGVDQRVETPPVVMVRQGRALGETEPIFVQVDGEAYKVFGLRSLEISFRGRANMVTFLDQVA